MAGPKYGAVLACARGLYSGRSLTGRSTSIDSRDLARALTDPNGWKGASPGDAIVIKRGVWHCVVSYPGSVGSYPGSVGTYVCRCTEGGGRYASWTEDAGFGR